MHFAGRQVGKVQDCLAAAQQGKVPMQQLLRKLALELTGLPGRTPALARSVVSAFLSNEEVRNVMREEIAGRGRLILAQILALGQERGEIRDDVKPIELAGALQQSLFGTLLLWSLNPVDPLPGVIEKMVGVLWTGMQVSPSKSSRKKVQR